MAGTRPDFETGDFTDFDMEDADSPYPASSPPASARRSGSAVTTPEIKNGTATKSAFTPTPKSKNCAKTDAGAREEASVDHADQGDEGNSANDEGQPPLKKVKIKAVATDTPKQKTPKSRSRKPPGSAPLNCRTIARSYDECTPEDKALIDLRDSGKSWPEIREAWAEMTGEKPGASTLPNRYTRLKNNFTVIKEEDNAKLLDAKHEVETAFEKEKWGMIAKNVEGRGGDIYKAEVLQRQYKKLMLQANAIPPPNVRDKDFDIALEDEN